MVSTPPLTQYLNQWCQGDDQALEQAMPYLRPTLERIARTRFSGERSNHTLDPGDLIGDLYLRLNRDKCSWKDRQHFYAMAGKMMQQILVDYARKHNADKRGNQYRTFPNTKEWENAAEVNESNNRLLALEGAMKRLREKNKRAALMLEWAYFLGLNQAEIATAMNLKERSVRRELSIAKAYVKHQMNKGVAG